MSYVCNICHKGIVYGNSIQHKRGVAGKRWKKRAQKTPRIFSPNLQDKTVKVGSEVYKMKLCAKCIKKIKKDNTIGEFTNITLL